MEGAGRAAGARRRDRIAALGLAAAVGLVFRSGLANGLVADDFSLINYCRPEGAVSLLQAFDPWRDTWYYRPVTKIVFSLSYALFGMAPLPYHVLSLLVHAGAVVLLFLVARRAGAGLVPSCVGALFFAVHFRQHESVFWFSAISYPLSTALGLASALAFRAGVAEDRRWLRLFAAVAAAGAMLTKDTAAVVPVLVGLYGVVFGRPAGGISARRTIGLLTPLAFVLLFGVGLQAIPVAGRPFTRGGAVFSPKGIGETAAFVERSAALAIPGADASGEPLRAALAAAAVVGLVGYALVRRTPLALFGLAWVLLAHAPFWAFVPRMGDLYLYLPLAGVGLVVADAAEGLGNRPRAAGRVLGAAAFLAFVVWSVGRIGLLASRWRAAGDVVNGVVAEVKEAEPNLAPGATLFLEGLPDTLGGIYAFNNAVPAAFWLAYGDRTLNVIRSAPGEGAQLPAGPRFLYADGSFYEMDEAGGRRLLRAFDSPGPP